MVSSFIFQGTNPVNYDINMVATYYQLGIRHMLMAYNLRNAVGDGCKERTNEGLSRFGVQLVEEMNRVGMVVDCTHTGPQDHHGSDGCLQGTRGVQPFQPETR